MHFFAFCSQNKNEQFNEKSLLKNAVLLRGELNGKAIEKQDDIKLFPCVTYAKTNPYCHLIIFIFW